MYFTMEQDRRIHNRIRFRDIDSNVCGEFLPEEFEQIRRALFEAEQMMRVTVPDSELAYLVEMIADAEIKER